MNDCSIKTKRMSFSKLKFIKLLLLITFIQSAIAQKTGVFKGHSDVGEVLHKGSVRFDKHSGNYTVAASGSNIWFTHDEFHFVWRKMKGDFILQARIQFITAGQDPHRKLGLMVRSTLDSSSSSVNATIHGDGLTSLQYRKLSNTNIEEIKFDNKAPNIIQLERKGNRYIMSVARFGDPYTTKEITGIDLGDEVYVGLFLCAHNKDVIEKAVFDNVRIIIPAKNGFVPYKDYIGSNIETFDLGSAKRTIVYTSSASLQAPNWTHSGKSLIYNSDGLIYKLKLSKKKGKQIPTGEVKNNNNDHVLSFDGKMIGLSSSSADGKYNSVVYTMPLSGGAPKQITPVGPSYLHGWSPDGKYLIYTGQRNGEFDIYKMLANGGDEVRLTKAAGLDDGSEYSPDGKYIYFNSVRRGRMQIWRMDADGSNQVQITSDEYNNWFPHISPDGKWLLFLSFMGDVKADDHPFYKNVYLRLMPVINGTPKVVVYLYGGQGSINTPSWSPDSKHFGFVSNSDLIIDK